MPLLGHGDEVESPNVGTIGYKMTKFDVSQHLHGGQGQDGGPQVPLLSHGNEIKSPNWECMYCRT